MNTQTAMHEAPYAAITRVLGDYFDGLYFSDSGRLARVFHPRAHYVCVSSGELQQLSMAEYLPMVAQRQSPASRGERRRDRIVSIEFAGAVTARARVECAIGPKYFDDFLTLVFIEDRWQIMSKIFHYELQAQPPATR